MVRGRREIREEAHSLAIQTNVKGKGIASHEFGTKEEDREALASLSRTASLNSFGESGDEQVHTHLSASSAGNTDISSSGFSSNSTARTSTMTDDDRPSASSPTTSSPHAHPSITILELASNTASSSALPDGFGFNLSRKGHFVAIYTASNIWLIKSSQLPRLWARTLEVKRKPVAIDILEDGSLLAVLSRPSQVDLYEIHGEQDRQIRKRRTIMLVHEASSMVISPDGLILITGNGFGIEVMSIGPDAPESCRRTLSGPVGDSLEFSDDGRTLLITSYARKAGGSSMFVLPGLYDGPLNEEGVPLPASPEAVWTGLVLFPETARIARQATLLPDADTGTVNELFAFNAEEDTWGIYDIAAQRFTQQRMFLPDQQRWTRSEFLDDAMPAVSPNADLAAVALRMRGTTSIWLYQVPEWDWKPKTHNSELSPIQPCFCIPILHDNADTNQEIRVLRWVKINANVQRLIAVGNISTTEPDESEGPTVPQGSKGVVIVLDFDKTKPRGTAPLPVKTEYDLDPLLPGERLPEGSIDFDREVELVRTRTIAQRRAQHRESRRHSRIGSTPSRSHTTANREAQQIPTITRDDEGELTLEEAQAAFEAPYANAQPRSQSSLARAATVAAVSPANRRHLRALPFRPLEYRRADGLREFPHESDADGWVPPPPAYTATAEAAQSVSLSHPEAPPVPGRPNGTPGAGRLHATPGSSIPPVPPLPAGVGQSRLQPTHPYQNSVGMQSQSSTDLTTPVPHNRRPSLLHPSTFPSPQAQTSGRRRSSAASQNLPNQTNGAPQNQSAYQATANTMAARRPSLRSRVAIGSTVELRHPPPVIDTATGRRGSAPDTTIHRRPVPVPAQPQRVSMLDATASPSRRTNMRRAMLPRLTTASHSASRPQLLSAPPRSAPPLNGNPHANMGRAPPRPETRASVRERRKIGCVVM